MKKISKEELERLLKEGTMIEKVRVVIENAMSKPSNGGRGIISKKNLDLLFKDLSLKESEDYSYYIRCANAILSEKKTFILYEDMLRRALSDVMFQKAEIERAIGYSMMIEGILLDMEETVSLEKANEMRGRLEQSAKNFRIPVRTHWGTRTKVGEESSIKVEARDYDIHLAIDAIEYALKSAKGLVMNLDNFLDKYKIHGLLPDEYREIIAFFKSRHTIRKAYIPSVYQACIDDKENGILARTLRDDNMDLSAIIPTYADIEPDEGSIKANIFERWMKK